MLAWILLVLSQIEVPFDEKRLAVIPEGTESSWTRFDVYGKNAGCVVKKSGKMKLFVDGTWSPEFDLIMPLDFLSDGRALYKADTGDSYVVVVGDHTSEKFDFVLGPRPSPDGSRYGFLANKGGKAEKRGVAPSGGEWFVVVDGEKHGPSAYATSPVFSRTGKHFAFVAEVGERSVVFLDGKRVVDCDHASDLSFYSDEHLLYVARNGNEASIVRGDLIMKVGRLDHSVIVSPDGKKIAREVPVKPEGFAMVVDGEPGVSFDVLVQALFSPDGSRLAYVGIDTEKMDHFVVVDEKKSEPFSLVSSLSFSRDGKRFIYEAQDKDRRWYVVLDGKKIGPFDSVHGTAFSPDGSVLAYSAKHDGKEFVVVGEEKSEPYDDIGDPVFSPDGKKVAFGARIGRELWWKVLNLE